jgi:hypothetical protein
MSQRLLRRAACLLACILTACALWAPAANAAAPAPGAFQLMPTYGVSFGPAEFLSGQLSYTVSLDSDAYIVYQETQYPITMVWGFFAVNTSEDSANCITATGPDFGDWKWNQNPNKGTVLNVAGWMDPSKKQALVTPASGSLSKQFTFTTFSYSGDEPAMGLHLSVAVPAGKPTPFPGGVTGDVIPTSVPTVAPEPSSVAALVFGLAGLALRKRR